MTKKADTWMPWYVADYLADTAHLSTEQHGAYCLMLMAAWKRGGSLPKDDAQLAAVSRMPAARWKASKNVLLAFFVEGPDTYTHKRVTSEWEKAQATSQKKARTGAEGAAKRWRHHSVSGGEPNGKPMANPLPRASQIDAPSPSPSDAPSELSGADAPVSPLPTGDLDDSGSGIPPLPTGDLDDSGSGIPPCPQRRLLALFKAKVHELPQPRPELWAGSKGADAMRARWVWVLTERREDGTPYATNTEDAVDWFGRFFDKVAQSDFLTGRNGRWRNCDLTWLMTRDNFRKVVEGNYHRDVATAA